MVTNAAFFTRALNLLKKVFELNLRAKVRAPRDVYMIDSYPYGLGYRLSE